MLFLLSLLDKIKDGGTLAYRDILRKQTQNANQHSKNSQFSSNRITELATLLGNLNK